MNNKKIIVSISVLIILILSIVLFNKNAPNVIGGDNVATTTDITASTTAPKGKMVVNSSVKPTTIVNESGNYAYTNGVFWGVITKSNIANGKLILTVDFLQSFSSDKETAVAAIEDDMCQPPSNEGIKNKQEFLAKVKSLSESEVDEFMSKTGCFPNGIVYYRNSSPMLRSKDVATNFIAYFPEAPSFEITNTGDMNILNKILNIQGPANPKWQITIKDNKVVELNQPFTP